MVYQWHNKVILILNYDMKDNEVRISYIVDALSVERAVEKGVQFCKLMELFYKTYLGKMIGEKRLCQWCEWYINRQLKKSFYTGYKNKNS